MTDIPDKNTGLLMIIYQKTMQVNKIQGIHAETVLTVDALVNVEFRFFPQSLDEVTQDARFHSTWLITDEEWAKDDAMEIIDALDLLIATENKHRSKKDRVVVN